VSERAADAPPHAELSAVRQPRTATTRRRGVMRNVTSEEGRVREVVFHGPVTRRAKFDAGAGRSGTRFVAVFPSCTLTSRRGFLILFYIIHHRNCSLPRGTYDNPRQAPPPLGSPRQHPCVQGEQGTARRAGTATRAGTARRAGTATRAGTAGEQ